MDWYLCAITLSWMDWCSWTFDQSRISDHFSSLIEHFLTCGHILRHRRSQEPITWSLQLLYIFVMAFSQTSLFLVRIYRELRLPTRAHRPIKISTWLISNFLVNISKEKQQRDARLLAIVRVQIHMNKGVPSSHLDKKQTINSCKRYMLCDSV